MVVRAIIHFLYHEEYIATFSQCAFGVMVEQKMCVFFFIIIIRRSAQIGGIYSFLVGGVFLWHVAPVCAKGLAKLCKRTAADLAGPP